MPLAMTTNAIENRTISNIRVEIGDEWISRSLEGGYTPERAREIALEMLNCMLPEAKP